MIDLWDCNKKFCQVGVGDGTLFRQPNLHDRAHFLLHPMPLPTAKRFTHLVNHYCCHCSLPSLKNGKSASLLVLVLTELNWTIVNSFLSLSWCFFAFVFFFCFVLFIAYPFFFNARRFCFVFLFIMDGRFMYLALVKIHQFWHAYK